MCRQFVDIPGQRWIGTDNSGLRAKSGPVGHKALIRSGCVGGENLYTVPSLGDVVTFNLGLCWPPMDGIIGTRLLMGGRRKPEPSRDLALLVTPAATHSIREHACFCLWEPLVPGHGHMAAYVLDLGKDCDPLSGNDHLSPWVLQRSLRPWSTDTLVPGWVLRIF